ncbi:MAG: hypothetical protein MUC54_04165 [Chloroflexi bacterium]|jgi:hypothetical protein|nr:hypothetical protein [Chloroflexota bacterium]
MHVPPVSESAPRGRPILRGPLAELALVGTALIAVGVLVPAPAVFVVAVLAGVAIALGTLALAAEVSPGEPAIEATAVPGVMILGAILAGRLVPASLLLAPVVAVASLAVVAAVEVERRIRGRVHGPTAGDRGAVRALALVAAFAAFAGIAAGIPGALVEPAGAGDPIGALPADAVTVLALADAAVAGLLGYRLAVLRGLASREAALAAASYALVIAIAAVALRAMAIPRFLGPALLILVLYLWDVYRASPRPARRDLRSLWEIGLLLLVGVVVVAWNLLNRG